jgi:glycosyltransferase involved in cell wall biosynthesis
MTTQSPRIAFVSVHDPLDPHTWSGIPHAILTHLRRAGATVEVIGPLNRNARLLVFPAWITNKITRRAYHPEREPRVTAAYAKQIERRMSGRCFDAILSTDTLVISRVDRPEPITYWTDGVWDLMANYYYMRPSKGFYEAAKQHEQQAIAKAAHSVYSSEWAAAGAKKYYQAADAKLAVIPFGANLEIAHGRDFIASAITARRRDSCVLLFLGVDWERKGGRIALETARLLNRQGLKTELIVAGCSVPGEKPDFVKEVGFLSKRSPEGRSQIADLLKSSHFLVLPTRAECAGVVFSEASAFGLPIITSDTGGISTYVRQAVNGIRIPLSAGPDVYAEHIYRLFHDRAGYEAMAFEAWQEYEQRLNWKCSIANLLSLLSQS